MMHQLGSILLAALGLLVTSVSAAPYSLDLSDPKPFANLQPFKLGTAVNPQGVALTANGVSLLQDGKPIVPVMGEFHYAALSPGRMAR